jgi:hypothetical protein
VRSRRGMSLVVVLGIGVFLAIIATVIPSMLKVSDKQIGFQRAEAVALILEMSIRSALDNPRSYSSLVPPIKLQDHVKDSIEGARRSVPGMLCKGSAVFCEISVIPASLKVVGSGATQGYEVSLEIKSPTMNRKIKTFFNAVPSMAGTSVVGCFDPTQPIFAGLTSSGVAVCRPLPVATCASGEYLAGISKDLRAICKPLEDKLVQAGSDRFIGGSSFKKGVLTLVESNRLSEAEMLSGGDPVVKLKPIEFEPRTGRFDNIDYLGGPLYHNDTNVVKCPDSFPEAKVLDYKVDETVPGDAKCTTKYTEDGTSSSVACISPNPNNKIKLKVQYECGAKPGVSP